jgi:CheY-like chemotaxis protein
MQDDYVLMIDDDSVFTDIIGNCLSHDDIRCVYVPSGAIALDLLAKETLPSVILLDIRMPDMDGFAVLERLKKDSRTASIPVVMFSNDSAEENEERALQYGAARYIQKVSVVPGEVVDVVKSVMQ